MTCRTSAPGRLHFYLRGQPLEEVVKHVQAGIMPLVWEHLRRTVNSDEKLDSYISEVQLLVAESCAVDQFWHVDNAGGGLTVFVPLTEVREDMGATLFLPGTNHLFDMESGRLGRWHSFISSTLCSDGIAVGTIEAGDALVYDARTFHRCATNRRLERARIALVFRYDVNRPPGLSALGTQTVAWKGSMINSFHRFYSTLPGA